MEIQAEVSNKQSINLFKGQTITESKHKLAKGVFLVFTVIVGLITILVTTKMAESVSSAEVLGISESVTVSAIVPKFECIVVGEEAGEPIIQIIRH